MIEQKETGIRQPDGAGFFYTSKSNLSDVREWLAMTGANAMPRSLMDKGMIYLNNQWKAFDRYLEDADLALTSNYAERLSRTIAGRNKW